MVSDTVHVNLKGLIFALGTAILLIVFAVGAITNGDPLWFLPVFTDSPELIVVYRDGCRIPLTRGQAAFDNLTRTLQATLPQVEGYSSSYGMSQESLDEYRQRQRALEVSFAKPVTIHSSYGFGHPDSLFIPLNSYMGDNRSVFGGKAGVYWAGALRLKSTAELQQAVNEMQCSP